MPSDWEESTHRRHKLLGHSLTPFRNLGKHAATGIVAVALVALVPVLKPAWAPQTERIATLAALGFLLAAPGLWFRMGRRALIIAFVLVGILYATSALVEAWHPFGIHDAVGDLFVVAVVTSFLVFALAGFNLVFIGEEIVYDAHRFLHFRHPIWQVVPFAVSLLLAFAVPVLERRGIVELPTLWIGACVCLAILGAWWGGGTFKPLPQTLLRELHLFAYAILLACLVIDGIAYLQAASEFVPSLVAFLILLGTWVYVSYTTLQRAHFLIRGNNAAPWLAILLAGSFAIVAHGQALYRYEGHAAVEDLVAQRLTYMAIGIWVGVVFLAARSGVRGLQMLRGVLGPKGSRLTRGIEKLPATVLAAERIMGDATYAAFRGMDEALPGSHRAPERPAPTVVEGDPLTTPAAPKPEAVGPETQGKS